MNNEHSTYSNTSLTYLDEDSIDRLYNTNLSEEYTTNEKVLTNYSNQKANHQNNASRWIMKTKTPQSIESKDYPKCAVCSDTASGTRYGVCVCEGCKEFFRRQRENANSRQLYCVDGNNACIITMQNRTQCRKCRLEKCIQLGMKMIGK